MGSQCCHQVKPPDVPLDTTLQPGREGSGDGVEVVSPQGISVVLARRALPPTPEQLESMGPMFRAMFDYDAITPEDLSFKKGDLLEVKVESQSDDWWQARHVKPGTPRNLLLQEDFGYIPRNYVCKHDTLQSQDWWFDVDRDLAVTLLLRPYYPRGTFLVRHATDRASMALSVRDVNDDGEPCVRHYRVQKLATGGVTLMSTRKFNTMQDLIEHYSSPDASGLCTILAGCFQRSPPPPSFRDCEVRRADVTIIEKVGGGNFGDVYKGRLKNGTDVAIKWLKSTCSMTSEKFLEEAKIMHKLQHERLVQLVAVVTESKPYFIMTEFMVNGSLLDYLRQDGGNQLTYHALLNIASQIAEGMAFLEQEHYIHRDLRAANILVGEYLEVKVADFGLARVLEGEGKYKAISETKFPVKWTAPEAAIHGRMFSIKSDVWSFGIVLYEMITFGKIPYPGMTGAKVMMELNRGYRIPRPTSPLQYDDAYYDVMRQCWHEKPEDRPTFEFLQHHFSHYHVSTEEQYED